MKTKNNHRISSSSSQNKSVDKTYIEITITDNATDQSILNTSFTEIFDIPIYRCSLEQHKLELEREKEKFVSIATGDSPEMERLRKNLSILYDDTKWYMWKYNEIIGWINLHSVGHLIKGDIYLTDKSKKITRRGKKTFINSRIAFDIPIYGRDTSEVIFSKVLERLRSLPKTYQSLRKRYIDLTKFENAGRFIDWYSLVRA
jgi:hypothetical protein